MVAATPNLLRLDPTSLKQGVIIGWLNLPKKDLKGLL
jgi:hypothetical protein